MVSAPKVDRKAFCRRHLSSGFMPDRMFVAFWRLVPLPLIISDLSPFLVKRLNIAAYDTIQLVSRPPSGRNTIRKRRCEAYSTTIFKSLVWGVAIF